MTCTATMLADRIIVRVSGDDPRAFLQGLVTHDLTLLAPERPLWAGLLTPQGKALFDFVLWDDGDDAVLIDCEATQAEALVRRLTLYRLRRAIDFAPAAGAVHWSITANTGVSDPRLPALGRRWLGTAGATAEGWCEHRLGLGVSEGVAELGTGETLWLECNADLLDGVSFTKGCYVGQENAARMHHRGKVARRLAVVPDGNAVPDRHCRIDYPELNLAVVLRRVAEWGNALTPPWLAASLAEHASPT